MKIFIYDYYNVAELLKIHVRYRVVEQSFFPQQTSCLIGSQDLISFSPLKLSSNKRLWESSI